MKWLTFLLCVAVATPSATAVDPGIIFTGFAKAKDTGSVQRHEQRAPSC